MKSLFVGCLGLIVGVIVGAALVYAAMSTAFKPGPALEIPAASGRPDLSVTVSSQFAATQIQQAIRTSGIAKNATVAFAAPNLIRVAATVDVNALGLPVSVNVTVAMRVTVQKGRIALTTDAVDAAGFALPPAVINSVIEPIRVQVEGQINRLMENALAGANLRASSIHVTAEALTLEFTGQ